MLIDVPQNKAYALLTGGPTVFITSRSPEGRDNVMANAWNTLFNMDPTQVIVVFDLGHDSTKNIIASGEFGISVPGNALKKGLIGAGTMHARDITEDKFAYAHLEKLPARQINAWLTLNAASWILSFLLVQGLPWLKWWPLRWKKTIGMAQALFATTVLNRRFIAQALTPTSRAVMCSRGARDNAF